LSAAATPDETFARTLMRWQRRHGRHDLPWQADRDPYRVWLSEIMLQQTQVVTVKPYFARFVLRFPDVAALAQASVDEVLGLWSGLGYYSRARFLHRCAQQVMDLHGGQFPRTARGLQQLPGLGASTAAAVASVCFGERVAILDGNVQRVLTRYLGFDADLSRAANLRALREHATALLPQTDLPRTMPCYTQAVMDLGAMVCTPKQPQCADCPLRRQCRAHAQGFPTQFPVKPRPLKRQSQGLWLLCARRDDGAVWLNQRPATGIWAGLYCLPLFDNEAALRGAVPSSQRKHLQELPAFKHVLTHKDLHLHPVQWTPALGAPPAGEGAWWDAARWPELGLPAPVRRLLLR